MAAGLLAACSSLAAVAQSGAAGKVSQYGITWRFHRDVEVGRFVNGDYWVLGAVKLVQISNDLNSSDFKPRLGQNGSMINPRGDGGQGYDDGAKSYRPELNAALPGGRPLSPDNPLKLEPGQSLVSTVSWLYRSGDDREPGCPKMYATGTPRPALRSAAVLTCLAEPPAADAFRPPYCGEAKNDRFTKIQIQRGLLKSLAPVGKVPEIDDLVRATTRPWIDHVTGWSGAVFHPTNNMPEYGREIGQLLNKVALALQLDFGKLPGKPDRNALLVNYVQIGIDLAAVADTGGNWPPDGGHSMGRKWPILFAGLMLDDAHMKSVGEWGTLFQEDAQTFFVSSKAVEITNSDAWNPDRRSPVRPYSKEDIGTAEWGIRHATDPRRDNAHWAAIYRGINNSVIPGIALSARIMGQKEAWNHDAMFDYADRAMAKWKESGDKKKAGFVEAMWEAYRDFGRAQFE